MKVYIFAGAVILLLSLLTPDEEKRRDNGKVLYAEKCLMCHAIDGKPNEEMQKNYNKTIPDIGKNGRLSGLSDDEIFVLLRGGAKDAIMYQKAKEIDDEALDDLIFFIRQEVCKCKYNEENGKEKESSEKK